MLVTLLKDIIPSKLDIFKKFERGDPYYFFEWEEDEEGETYLRYWFKKRTRQKCQEGFYIRIKRIF